jgi:hypothetical protein
LNNKLFAVAAAFGIILSLAGSSAAHDEKKDSQPGEKVERTLTVDPQATITLCVASGALTVRAWDKSQVRVISLDAEQLEFRRIDKPKDPNTPATRIDVMVLDKTSRAHPKLDCQAIADVKMDVPAGATVQVQTRDGDINIAGVAAAYAGSQNGDITIERAKKLVEAGSVGGSIILRDSSGRVNLSSAGGGVEVTNVRGATADDTFEVGTVSGDIQLDGIASPRVMAKTVSGTLKLSGALVKSGYYAFTNVTGDVVLALPHDASFRLNAKVSEKKDIVSEFPLKYLSEAAYTPPPPPSARYPAPPAKKEPASAPAVKEKEKLPAKEKIMPKAPPPAEPGPIVGPIVVAKPAVMVPYVRRFEAICGTGDATISVASFGGMVMLKKL